MGNPRQSGELCMKGKWGGGGDHGITCFPRLAPLANVQLRVPGVSNNASASRTQPFLLQSFEKQIVRFLKRSMFRWLLALSPMTN